MAKAAASRKCCGEVHLSRQSRLVGYFEIATALLRKIFQCLLGSAWPFRVSYVVRVTSEQSSTTQRLRGSQEPGFVLPARHDYETMARADLSCPFENFWRQLARTIIVRIKDDRDTLCSRLTPCQLDEALQAVLSRKLGTSNTERATNSDVVDVTFREEPSKQNWYSLNFAMPFNNRLDHCSESSNRLV